MSEASENEKERTLKLLSLFSRAVALTVLAPGEEPPPGYTSAVLFGSATLYWDTDFPAVCKHLQKLRREVTKLENQKLALIVVLSGKKARTTILSPTTRRTTHRIGGVSAIM